MFKNLNKIILAISALVCIQSSFAVVCFSGNTVYSGKENNGNENEYHVFKTVFSDNANQDPRISYFDNMGSKPQGIALDSNGTGFVVTDDGNLDYYENSKFIKTTHTFDDGANGLSYTGNAVYVITGDKSKYNAKELKKCSKNGDNCQRLDTFANYPSAVSFDANGNGYVLAGNKLYKYVNDVYIGKSSHTFEDHPNAVSFTGNAVYILTQQAAHHTQTDTSPRGQVFKCTIDDDPKCNVIDNIYVEFPNGIAFDEDGNGYVDGSTGYGDHTLYLFKYTNDKFISTFVN